MSAPAARCQLTTASLSARSQVATASAGSAGSSMSRRPSAIAHVVRVHHPGHAVAHRAQVVDVGVDERARVERRPCGGAYRRRDAQLRMRLDDVVLLDERLLRELPVHGEPARVPPLGPQRLDLPRVEDRGERLDALPQRRGVVVEVDPRASAPHLAPHRREVDVVGLQVVLGERLRAAGRTCSCRRRRSTSRGTGR